MFLLSWANADSEHTFCAKFVWLIIFVFYVAGRTSTSFNFLDVKN